MIGRRTATDTPAEQLADYVYLFNVANVLDPDDVVAATEAWQNIAEKSWYKQSAELAHRIAERSGRLTKQGIVTGDLSDPQYAAIGQLADIIPGGAVIDVALAVLVADLLAPADYRKLTNWWSRYESTWLPGHPRPDDTAPPTEPAPEPQPPAQPPVQPRARPTAGDPAAAGAIVTEPPPRLAGTRRDAPATTTRAPGRPPRPRTARQAPPAPPVEVPREKILSAAQQKALDTATRRRRAFWANTRGNGCSLLALLTVIGVGDQLGPFQVLPPASIWIFGDGWGRLICALIWLALGIFVFRVALLQYRLATSLRRKKQG